MTASEALTSQNKLEASTFQRLHPRAYLERFLAEDIRPDGRDPKGWRNVNVNVGEESVFRPTDSFEDATAIGSITTAEGSALVRVGNTTIVCGIKAEIAEPELDRPAHGFLGK
jgi:exosome complex component RRP43